MSSSRTLSWLIGVGILAAGCGPSTPEPAVPDKGGTPVAAPSGTAVASTCAEGKGECDGNAATACETDLAGSAQHCGACGNACAAGQSCSAGACRAGQSISASGANACVVISGRVVCWGDNSANLLASGGKGPRATPVKIAGIEQATLVRTGRRVGCAVTSEGKVACFHDGAAREIALVSDVTDLGLQDTTVVLLHKDGKVNAVDVGDSAKDLRPVEIPTVKDATQISASSYHACALQKSGEVTCWGDPAYTGSGKDTSNMDWQVREELGKKATRVKDLKDATQISVSDTHACALRKSKQIMCWGSNWSGELGDGTQEHRFAPVAVQLLDDAVEVTAGHHHTCARRAGGKVVCWGEGRSGQLGSGSASVKGMVEVQGVTDAASITAGEDLSCAVRASGAVACWGAASRGRLGNGVVSDYVTPQPVKGVAGVTALALGDRYSCAVDGNKHLQCWGVPGYSDEDMEKRGENPTQIPVGEVDLVTLKDTTMTVIDKAGAIYSDSTYQFLKEPKKINLGKVKWAKGGGSFGSALLPSGQVVLWTRDWSKPGEVLKMNLSGLADAVSVAHDSSTVCAVRKSGKVACVGYSYRTFEKKDAIKPTSPVEVPGVTDGVSIAGESGDMCILRKTGEVSCFSPYRVPQPVDPKAPVDKEKAKEKPLPIEVRPVKNLADVAQLAMGGASRCAVLKSGGVSCWGTNSYGQLGTGDYGYSWDPVPVAGLTDVATVAVGSGQVCAAKKNGDVLCWGQNTSDQAGQPAPSFARAPTAVLLPRD